VGTPSGTQHALRFADEREKRATGGTSLLHAYENFDEQKAKLFRDFFPKQF